MIDKSFLVLGLCSKTRRAHAQWKWKIGWSNGCKNFWRAYDSTTAESVTSVTESHGIGTTTAVELIWHKHSTFTTNKLLKTTGDSN